MNTQILSSTRHFHFRQITPGVYAALSRPDGLAASNCGIVDLGERTVVIDTSLSPQAALDVRTAAFDLTGHEANLVLLTHHHVDHIGGLQAFDQKASLFSSAQTLQLLVQNGAENLSRSREASQQTLQARQKSLAIEKDKEKQAEIVKLIEMAQERMDVANATRLRMPDLTSHGQAAIYGTNRHLEFIPFPKAHCPGNSIVHLPQDGVIFMGDLLFARRHPYMREGDPHAWLAVLDQIEMLKPEIIVPGHGGVSSLVELRMLADYIRTIMQLVHEFVQAGKPVQALGEIQLPEPYNLWEPKEFLSGSLSFLYDLFTETGYVQKPMFDMD